MSDVEAEIIFLVKESFKRLSEKFLGNNFANDKISLILAVSGGIDSSVLFHLFCSLEKEIPISINGVCHLNHGIRNTSDFDEEFVRKTSYQHNISFFSKKLSPPKTGVELWGRKERYEFFSEILEKTNSNLIVTAHHLDDEIETFLFRLITGRSISHQEGLIRELDFERRIYRPFISLSKKQIELYANSKSLLFVGDETNNDINYSRNFIRHNIIPHFEHLNNSFRRSLLLQMQLMQKEEAFLEDLASSYVRDFSVEGFDKIPEVLRERVLKSFASKQVGNYALCISRRRYEVLGNFILKKPSETKKIDMGQNITAIINKNSAGILELNFIRN